ncbi:MFS transporter [Amycolatopsis sp. H20-H5]|uniref:MFS transporter n=1 Tax=Amycolatopsis sp. H20-H5 TaxID=3046309 RepID=UPI002DB7DEEF|nr:MFS transporter [Amycolatopsis sp. H20-H5]MEC3977105.1 MFS transporter [Amycolatopsis sp. H20-H5]
MAEPAARARLLRGNPAFRALCASRAVSFTGDGITATVLVLLAADQDGPAGVGLLLLANALPRLGGPLAGALADRVVTRTLMMRCELASALVAGLIAATLPPLPVLVAFVAAAGALATIRNPAGRGLVPVLVGPADRAPANALFGLARTLQLAVGPGLGGLLAAGPGGVHTALAVDAATFVVSALLLARLPALAPARDPEAVTGVWAEAAAGLRYVGAHRQVRVLVLTLFLIVAFAGVDNVALVFLTGDQLATGPAGYGLATGAFGAGMLVTAAACTRLARGRSPAALLLVSTAATGAGTALTGLAPVLAVVVAAQLLAGAGNAGENIGYDTLVQCLVPRAFLGRVFGTIGTAAQLGAAFAYTAGGLLVDLAGARAAFVLAGSGTLVLVPVLRRHTKRLRLGSSSPTGHGDRPGRERRGSRRRP